MLVIKASHKQVVNEKKKKKPRTYKSIRDSVNESKHWFFGSWMAKMSVPN